VVEDDETCLRVALASINFMKRCGKNVRMYLDALSYFSSLF
jgi:hypothetical protein